MGIQRRGQRRHVKVIPEFGVLSAGFTLSNQLFTFVFGTHYNVRVFLIIKKRKRYVNRQSRDHNAVQLKPDFGI